MKERGNVDSIKTFFKRSLLFLKLNTRQCIHKIRIDYNQMGTEKNEEDLEIKK